MNNLRYGIRQFTEPNINDLRNGSRSFEAVANYNTWPEAVAGGSEPARINVCAASRDFFRVLGVQPFVGRFFATEAGREGSEVAVVSYAFWRRLFGGGTSLGGSTLRFADRSFTVIGVMPPETAFPLGTDVWFPADLLPPNDSRTAHNWRAMARMREGVTVEQASAELASIGHELKREYGSRTDAASFDLVPLRERMVKDLRSILLILSACVGLVLVIACANVANLLLVHATTRRKEIAVRTALGASRMIILRQFINESLLLTITGGLIGVVLAFWTVDLIVGLYGGTLPAVGQIGVNWHLLLFTLTIVVITGVALGLVTGLHASSRRVQASLQEAGRAQSASRGTRRLRDILIVSQIALTLALLVVAGLLGRSFQRLLAVDPGFRPENVVAMTVLNPQPEDAASQRRLAQRYQQLLAKLETLPGAIAVGGTNALPMSGAGANGTFMIASGSKPAETMDELKRQLDGLSPEERTRDADYRVASPDYFRTLGVPLVRGRFFRESDGPDSQHVAIVSQSLAKRYWPGESPIGQQIQFGNMDGDLRLLDVVGEVGDVRDEGFDANMRPTIYVNYLQRPAAAAQFSFVVRANGDSTALISAMRREASQVNPDMPVKFETLKQIIASSLDQRRFAMVIVAIFAGAALLLAMVGLYGVMAFAVNERTQEIGIRMALGAQARHILQNVLSQGLFLVFIGGAAGIVAAIFLTRLMAHLLFGVSATDPITLAGVGLLLGLVALVACYFPARRATRIDPAIALRAE